MGGKDLQVLFAMAIGCTTHDLPDHQDTPFSKAKMYHSEVKPDAATLKLEVTRQWKAYFFTCHQPHPSNWKFKKKLNDSRYKMVKVISDWECSSTGAGMVNNIVDDSDAEPMEYEFLDGNDCKSFLREHPPHILYLWHLSHKYGIFKNCPTTVRWPCCG